MSASFYPRLGDVFHYATHPRQALEPQVDAVLQMLYHIIHVKLTCDVHGQIRKPGDKSITIYDFHNIVPDYIVKESIFHVKLHVWARQQNIKVSFQHDREWINDDGHCSSSLIVEGPIFGKEATAWEIRQYSQRLQTIFNRFDEQYIKNDQFEISISGPDQAELYVTLYNYAAVNGYICAEDSNNKAILSFKRCNN